jgi:hypothetical protein
MADEPSGKGGTGPQLLGSLAVAALIVALAVWAVTAKLGPTSIADREAAEEQAEDAEETAEDKAEEAGDSGGGRRRRGRDQ